jgi:NAD(P)-dependent dehydrogenase (short-subunit alcohol dehydrogenase family)
MTPTASRTGQWIFVAGAAGKVGCAVSARLASEGANLVLHGRANPPDRDMTGRGSAGSAHQARGQELRVHGDLTEPSQVEEIRHRLHAHGIDRLHALINCVTGFDGQPVAVADLPVKEFRRVVDTDLVGSFVLVQSLLPLLRGPQRARVVLLSSLAAVRGRPGAAHLCAAKAGLHGLAVALTQELAREGIVVHVAAPGPIGHPPGSTSVPASSADQVADVLAYLVSPRGDLLSGQVLQLQAIGRAL